MIAAASALFVGAVSAGVVAAIILTERLGWQRPLLLGTLPISASLLVVARRPPGPECPLCAT